MIQIIILKNIPYSEAPSILPALIKSFGIPNRYCLKKNTVDAPLLKIGAGSGLMATSIAMKLKEYDPTSFDRVRNSFKRCYNFEFPKSRKGTKQGKPFGWVKLEFN